MLYKIEYKKLGARYKKIRLARKMTQYDVREYGFSVRHYQHLESGRPHSLKTFFRVSEMFNIDPEEMIKGIFSVG
jgi:transcriptional regulator with XRE-family HTH domain